MQGRTWPAQDRAGQVCRGRTCRRSPAGGRLGSPWKDSPPSRANDSGAVIRAEPPPLDTGRTGRAVLSEV